MRGLYRPRFFCGKLHLVDGAPYYTEVANFSGEQKLAPSTPLYLVAEQNPNV